MHINHIINIFFWNILFYVISLSSFFNKEFLARNYAVCQINAIRDVSSSFYHFENNYFSKCKDKGKFIVGILNCIKIF